MNGNHFEPQLVRVYGGTFTMGKTDKGDDNRRSKPAHLVKISDFQIAIYPVTFKEYGTFCSETSRIGVKKSFLKADNCPVVGVSWEDAKAFCKWLQDKTGKPFRLPTEGEWEYAARGGQSANGYRYAGGNNIGKVCWYKKNAKGKVRPVGQNKPNELGLHDMSGNIWEWCLDGYRGYRADNQEDPFVQDLVRHKVIRGGSCNDNKEKCYVYSRNHREAQVRSQWVGFRVACGDVK